MVADIGLALGMPMVMVEILGILADSSFTTLLMVDLESDNRNNPNTILPYVIKTRSNVFKLVPHK